MSRTKSGKFLNPCDSKPSGNQAVDGHLELDCKLPVGGKLAIILQDCPDCPMNTQPPALPPVSPGSSSEDRFWILACHLSVLAGVGIILPLVVHLVKKDESTLVAYHAKEALNFHLSILIYSAICIATCVGAPFVIGIGIAGMVLSIIAAVKSSDPTRYRYPLTLRLVP